MTVTGKFQDYSKDQLISELQELLLKFNELHSSFQRDITERKLIEENLIIRTALLSALNQYAIDLSDLEGENLYQFIVEKFKEIFKVRAAWISTFNEITSELTIESSTVTSEENSVILKFIGRTAKRYHTKVTEASHARMINNVLNPYSSLHELSFGQIPETVGLAIEKAFSIGWFMGISLIDKGKLYGTMVVAGKKGQEMPENELVRLFSELTSNVLRRKQAELKLLHSESKFKTAFFTSPDAVNINRLTDGMYVSINKGFTKLTGYSEEDVIGKTSIELNIWALPADREKLVKGLKEKGEVENLEATFVKKNGSVTHGIMSAAIIDLNGEPNILSITRDISDRKYAEIAVRESEARFRELIELAVDGILLGSSDGTIIGANSCMLALTGRTLNEILGMHVSDLFDPSTLNDSPLRFDKLMKGETVMNERLLLRHDKSVVPVEMRTKMMPDGSYQSIYRDISSRKKAEQELRESEEKVQSIFRVAPVGIGLTVNRVLMEVNDYLCTLLGYERGELINKSSEILYPSFGEYERVGKEKYGQIALKGTGTLETVFKCKNERLLNVILSSTPLDTGDLSKGVTFTVLDISDRIKAAEQMKIAKEKAEASDKLKTSFLNNISHEVRTPLNGILGFAELISKEDLSGSERDEAISMVHESSDRLLRTITNYMDISMLTSGNMSYSERQVDPSLVLKNIHNNFVSKCSARKLDFLIDLPENGNRHLINSDPEFIEKILSHFMDNAIKFTSKGYIKLGYSVNQHNLEFFVQDTGHGISDASIESIFNRFVKEDISSGRVSEGSGLGLSIAKGLAETAGGEVRVVSEPGKGSTFFLKMLLNDTLVDAASGNVNKNGYNSAGKNTILIAEDDEINFFYINALLSRVSDSKVIHAENGREAIELFKSNSDIKLILMDIKMPEVDGLEATRQIKEINPDIPIIAITAYAMSGDEDRVMAAGCNGYLSKPIRRDTLLAKMGEFVQI